MTFRSLLFVPGSRPERFEKALAAGADAVCIDLEDAVAPDAKDEARRAVAAFVRDGARKGLGVRINGWASDHFAEDCRALKGLPAAFVMVPKAENPDQLGEARDRLGDGAPPLWPIIESGEGLRQAWEIADAEGVGGVLFGAADYSAEVGCTLEWDSLLYARGKLAAAAARAGAELLDVPYLDVQDTAGLAVSTRKAKALGFTGRACIHPTQVAAVNDVFTPSPEETDRARRVVAAFEAAGGGAALLDGKLIELPVIRAARRTLERAEA
jgi:citrate lyase beta subunit